MPEVQWANMKAAEIRGLKECNAVAIVPIGSIEQHGPHLPLNTDVVLAEEFTRRIITRWGDAYDLWQLPTQAVSLAREHEWAPGTLSLSIEGMARLIRDLGHEIARSLPARNLAIINGHGGNRGILEVLAQDLRGDFGFNVCILHPTTWADFHAASKTPEIHGGKNETSMMLAVAPHLVHADEIKKLQTAPGADAVRATILDQSVTWPWTTNEKAIATSGVIGDAKSASAEFGEQLLEKVTDAAGGVFKQLLERQQLLRG